MLHIGHVYAAPRYCRVSAHDLKYSHEYYGEITLYTKFLGEKILMIEEIRTTYQSLFSDVVKAYLEVIHAPH